LLLLLLTSCLLLLDLVFESRELLEPVGVLGDKFLVVGVPNYNIIDILRIHHDIIEDDGLDVAVVLLHDVLVQELLLYFINALHVSVHYLNVLGTVAVGDGLAPLHAVELQVEVQDVPRIDEVNESETDTALSLQVHGQVEVVVFATVVPVEQLQHIVLLETNRDVLDHKSCQTEDLFIVRFI